MKRFVAHYLYSSSNVFHQYIVEVENGEVITFYPFSEEIESTVWLNGIIMLSLTPDYAFHHNTLLSDLIAKMTDGTNSKNPFTPVYAYFLSNVNFTNMTITEKSELIKLSDS